MAGKIKLKYGKTDVELNLPDTADVLSIHEPSMEVDEDRFGEEIDLALPEKTTAFQRISIVVADKTRRCGYDVYLPVLLEVLLNKGIQKQQITFFIAYGTHKPQSREECLDAYGSVYNEYPFIHHDSSDTKIFTHCGQTRRGTQVHIRKDFLKSDLIITFGALSHHYFAGYGGGRKLLFPGLGHTPDIYYNHSLFLDGTAKQLNNNCRPGNLNGNPLAEDLKEIDAFIQAPRISIHGILDSKSRVCRLIVAKKWSEFVAACTDLDSFYRFQPRKGMPEKQYSLVVASCGGYPKDINFIQAHKAVNNAAMFVKDNGCLVVLARCPDNIGSDTFLEYFEYQDFKHAFEIVKKDYKGNGGTALSMMSKTQRINIFLKTQLDDNICATIGVEKIENPKIYEFINKFQHDMACIENASLLIR